MADEDYQSNIQFHTIEEIDRNQDIWHLEEMDDRLYLSDDNKNTTEEDHNGENGDSSFTLCEGMKFADSETAYDFYKKFALKQRFSIRKQGTYNSKQDGRMTKRTFVCNKEGFKRADKREEGKQDIKRRRETREGCKAHMRVHITNGGQWSITSFSNMHTHSMIVSPKKKALLWSHEKVYDEPLTKSTIDEYHKCGIGPSKISRLINAQSRSVSKITPQQVIDHLGIGRKNNIGKECTIVLQKFFEMQALDSQFYYAIEIDENQVRQNIFWADRRARNSYMSFGDVVVFDVTYRTNNCLLSFAPFTGVNHHRQFILFGCALSADEWEETFVWLFEHWLKCMWGKHPGVIITDQDIAIRNAIKIVFSGTHHRFCKWHLNLHEDEHIRSLRASYNPEFGEYYMNWAKKS